MKRSLFKFFLLFYCSSLSFIQTQENEFFYDTDNDVSRIYKDFSCPMRIDNCQLKILIEHEDVEDYNVTEIRGIQYFNLKKLIACHEVKREYTEENAETMCISIEPILIGEGNVEIRNRKSNTIISISVYIIQPQSNLKVIEKLNLITLVIRIIQSIIIGSFLDSKRVFSTFKSICKCENTWKLLVYLLVAFTRIIVALIVSLNFYSKKENLFYSFFIQ